MAKVSVKLGKNARHFYDLSTRTSAFPGEVVKMDFNNSRVKAALAVGTLVRATKDEIKGKKEPEEIQDPLMEKTRNEIMEEYGFLTEQDLEVAEKQKTKLDLVKFLRSVEEDYPEED